MVLSLSLCVCGLHSQQRCHMISVHVLRVVECFLMHHHPRAADPARRAVSSQGAR